jgi:hypothetical protein
MPDGFLFETLLKEGYGKVIEKRPVKRVRAGPLKQIVHPADLGGGGLGRRAAGVRPSRGFAWHSGGRHQVREREASQVGGLAGMSSERTSRPSDHVPATSTLRPYPRSNAAGGPVPATIARKYVRRIVPTGRAAWTSRASCPRARPDCGRSTMSWHALMRAACGTHATDPSPSDDLRDFLPQSR